MNIAITTGNQVHQKYLVNIIRRYFPHDVKLVIIQNSKENSQNRKVVGWVDAIISTLFKVFKLFSYGFYGVKSFSVNEIVFVDDINSDEVKKLLLSRKINLLVVCGGKIIKKDIIESVGGNAINLHNGYSPYYKGSYTLFFPIIENKPHLVGTTIHWLTPEVDAGQIIIRNRLNPGLYFFKDVLFIASFKQTVKSFLVVLRLLLANFNLPIVKDNQKNNKVYYSKEFTQDGFKIVNKRLRHLFYMRIFGVQ
jgi:methionyl-tRNA formyltransferase